MFFSEDFQFAGQDGLFIGQMFAQLCDIYRQLLAAGIARHEVPQILHMFANQGANMDDSGS